MITASNELLALFGDRKHVTQRFNQRSRQKNTVEVEMDRLFARKVKIFDSLKFDVNSTIEIIAKLFFKSYYEYVRLEQPEDGGYQQLEVDVEFLKAITRDLMAIEDPALLSGLSNEVLSNSSPTTVKLDLTVIESIVEHRKSKLNI